MNDALKATLVVVGLGLISLAGAVPTKEQSGVHEYYVGGVYFQNHPLPQNRLPFRVTRIFEKDGENFRYVPIYR